MLNKCKKKLLDISNRYTFIGNVYKTAGKIKWRYRKSMSDETYAKLIYKETMGKDLNLDNPKGFNEKLWWLKLNNRDPLLTTCTDKYKVREYIRSKGLEHILVPLIGVYSDARDINFEELPDRAFIKTNNGSGTNAMWDRHKPFDMEEFSEKFNSRIKPEYYYWHTREWNYKNIEPKIIIEQVLSDKSPPGLIDYKFLCFDGKVKLVFSEIYIADEKGEHNPLYPRNVYDREFKLLDVKVGRNHFDPSLVKKPANYDLMVCYAEELSAPFPHCRVDLYNIDGRIYFGEMTFYHASGLQKIEPPEWDAIMGDWIDLDSEKIVLTGDGTRNQPTS